MTKPNITTKKKFDRIILKINKSIQNEDSYLPFKLCDEMRSCKIWNLWCLSVRNTTTGIPNANNRLLTLPKFIKQVTINGWLI